ncbi:hypothetical protein CerSpe_011480 [Prunus speciosa]
MIWQVENQEPTLEFWKRSLNPLTWTEILRQVLVAAGFGSKQGARRRDALSKGELFRVLLEHGIHGLKVSELAKSLQKVEESQSNAEDSGAVDDDLGDSSTCSSDDNSGCKSGNSKIKKLSFMNLAKAKITW